MAILPNSSTSFNENVELSRVQLAEQELLEAREKLERLEKRSKELDSDRAGLEGMIEYSRSFGWEHGEAEKEYEKSEPLLFKKEKKIELRIENQKFVIKQLRQIKKLEIAEQNKTAAEKITEEIPAFKEVLDEVSARSKFYPQRGELCNRIDLLCELRDSLATKYFECADSLGTPEAASFAMCIALNEVDRFMKEEGQFA